MAVHESEQLTRTSPGSLRSPGWAVLVQAYNRKLKRNEAVKSTVFLLTLSNLIIVYGMNEFPVQQSRDTEPPLARSIYTLVSSTVGPGGEQNHMSRGEF